MDKSRDTSKMGVAELKKKMNKVKEIEWKGEEIKNYEQYQLN